MSVLRFAEDIVKLIAQFLCCYLQPPSDAEQLLISHAGGVSVSPAMVTGARFIFCSDFMKPIGVFFVISQSETSNSKHSKMKVIVSDEIESVCPDFVGGCVDAQVVNTAYSEGLWEEINLLGDTFRATLTTETLKDQPGIAATRRVYRACGKDPSRYRPASEALIRRMLQGKSLYQINTLVDLINLASIKYGYSIGGFDAGKFVGDTLTLGVGRAGEPYEGIGRGPINIEGLPVYRDAQGGVGTPTSDNERTKIDMGTTHLIVLINGYDGNEEHVRANAEEIIRLVNAYCQGHDASYKLFR